MTKCEASSRGVMPVGGDPAVGKELANGVFFENYGSRILRSLRRVIRAVNIHSKKLNAVHGITGPQLICLRAISELEPIPLTLLAREVSVGISTVNGIVDRLEAKGLVFRARSNEDRRKVMICVTDEGRGVIKQTPSPLQDRLTEGLQELNELEQVAIALGLETIVELMEAERLDASPNLVGEPTMDARIEDSTFQNTGDKDASV